MGDRRRLHRPPRRLEHPPRAGPGLESRRARGGVHQPGLDRSALGGLVRVQIRRARVDSRLAGDRRHGRRIGRGRPRRAPALAPCGTRRGRPAARPGRGGRAAAGLGLHDLRARDRPHVRLVGRVLLGPHRDCHRLRSRARLGRLDAVPATPDRWEGGAARRAGPARATGPGDLQRRLPGRALELADGRRVAAEAADRRARSRRPARLRALPHGVLRGARAEHGAREGGECGRLEPRVALPPGLP